MTAEKFRSRQYWLRLLALFLVSTVVVTIALPVVLGAVSMLGVLYAPCSLVTQTPPDFGLSGEPVTLSARSGETFRGYFIPGTNGAVIIMPPPFNSGRFGRLQESAMLARYGYAVFMFESRRCAGTGPVSLGYSETSEVENALDYLLTRNDVDPEKIGIYGFSSAGATAIMTAAQHAELRAVVAEGGYADFAENTFSRGHKNYFVTCFLGLYGWAMRSTYHIVMGFNINRLSPVSVIGQISPRPVLLIYGSREPGLAGGKAQALTAGKNSELWIVEGAEHGNYLSVAPEEYEFRIITFFNNALLHQN